MKPIHFPEANLELQKPEDMTDEQCSPLPVCTCRTADNMPLVISCWEPTPEEWGVLRKQGHIFVAIVSEDSHPPLIVFPNNPFNQEEEPTSPQPPKEDCMACGGSGLLEDSEGRVYDCFCTDPSYNEPNPQAGQPNE